MENGSKRLRIQQCRILLLASILLASPSACTRSKKLSLLSNNDPPQIHLQLGEAIDEVQAHSSYTIKPGRPWLDTDMYVADAPTQVLYQGQGHDLVFPVGTYAAFDINKGHVVGFKVSPQTSYLDMDRAIALAEQISDLFQAAHWLHSMRSAGLTAAAIRKIFEQDQDTPKRIAVAIWENGGDEATVLITHQHSADDSFSRLSGKSSDSFVVIVDLENPEVLRKY